MGLWLLAACGSALFAGMTSILAKMGLSDTDSTVATAIRTGVVLVMAWLAAAVAGSIGQVATLAPATWAFLGLSGLSTGASWLCYFRALKLGDVSRVVPVDKASVVLTVLLACLLLGEPASPAVIGGIAAIAVGTYLMAVPKGGLSSHRKHAEAGPNVEDGGKSHSWLLYAVLSAVFASLTAILGKLGIEGVESNLGTALRTVVVLAMAWMMVAVEGKGTHVRTIRRRDLLFLILSGITTGASWLCYFFALQSGPASLVVPVDKLSVLVSVVLAFVLLRERPTTRNVSGLAVVAAGTLVMLL